MNLLDSIKERTKEDHQSVEKVLITELKSLSSLEEYGHLLERLYAFYKPLEDEIQLAIDTTFISDISARKHTERLLQDIHAIHASFKPDTTFNPLSISSTSYALGILYVIEGSTLGGQIIVKMLDKQLSVTSVGAHTYFDSYSEETQKMWTSFKDSMLKIEATINEEEMIRGAKETFSALQSHLTQTKS